MRNNGFNIKQNFLQEVKNCDVKCAELGYVPYFGVAKYFYLKYNFTNLELEEFLNSINFTISEDDFYGKIWLMGGSWLEFTHSENGDGWDHFECPEIPLQCQ